MAEVSSDEYVYNLPEKPDKPEDSSCCGNGCSPCVFDIYETEVLIWERECLNIKQRKHNTTNQGQILFADAYSQFKIISIEDGGAAGVFIYRFEVPFFKSLELALGQHIIIRGYHGCHSITRQYSPISHIHAAGYFDLLIKVYDNGKMSQIIKKWEVGTLVDVRGPFNEFQYKEHMFDNIYIICMGTGIAPMVSIITAILANENEEVVLKLIYGCSNSSRILIKKQLNEWSGFWNFKVIFAISKEENNSSSGQYGRKIYAGRISQALLETELELNKNYKILLCGSNSFNEDMIKYMNNLSIPMTRIHKF